MLRSTGLFTRSAIRRYASSAAGGAVEPKNDVFLKNLLEKVKTIKSQPSTGTGSTFVKKNAKGGNQYRNNGNKNNGERGNRHNNGQRNFNRNGNNNNNNINRRLNNRGNAPQEHQFSKADYTKQRRERVGRKYGSADENGVFDSTTNNRFKANRNNRKPAPSIFASTTGTRISPLKRTRNKQYSQTIDAKTQTGSKTETYTPVKPNLPELIKYSSNLAFNSETRLTRAVMQVLNQSYQVPDLYNDQIDLLDSGANVIIQQPLSTYPYNDKLPLSKTKVMGPTIIDVDFDFELLNKTIDKTVYGKFELLKIDVPNDKLKLNAQVVQNTLNRNIFYNYSGRKERIYKSCSGLEPVASLIQ